MKKENGQSELISLYHGQDTVAGEVWVDALRLCRLTRVCTRGIPGSFLHFVLNILFDYFADSVSASNRSE